MKLRQATLVAQDALLHRKASTGVAEQVQTARVVVLSEVANSPTSQL